MKNKGKDYNLNLDILVPFFIINEEEIKKNYKNELGKFKINTIRYAICPWNKKDDEDEE